MLVLETSLPFCGGVVGLKYDAAAANVVGFKGGDGGGGGGAYDGSVGGGRVESGGCFSVAVAVVVVVPVVVVVVVVVVEDVVVFKTLQSFPLHPAIHLHLYALTPS